MYMTDLVTVHAALLSYDFNRKLLRLKVWFVVKYVFFLNKPHFLWNITFGMQLKWDNASKYLSNWVKIQDLSCVLSQTERFLQIRLYCLFFKYVSFGEEKLNPEIVANVGL